MSLEDDDFTGGLEDLEEDLELGLPDSDEFE